MLQIGKAAKRKAMILKYSKYISINKNDPINLFGIECDYGWDKIIKKLLDKIARLYKPNKIYVSQIKEKYGLLRICVEYNPIYEQDILREKKLNSYINLMEAKSGMTCEICGKEGRIRVDLGWTSTLCTSHYKKQKREHKNFLRKKEMK